MKKKIIGYALNRLFWFVFLVMPFLIIAELIEMPWIGFFSLLTLGIWVAGNHAYLREEPLFSFWKGY